LVERLLKLIDDMPLLIATTSRPAPDGSDREFLARARLEHGERSSSSGSNRSARPKPSSFCRSSHRESSRPTRAAR
jgi:hypothetical protein